MYNKNEIAQEIVGYLLQIKAIKLQTENPFTWASGWKSPIYCDNRVTLSNPVIRTYIRQRLTELIQEKFGSVAVVAGVATAGIPQGVLVAQDLGLPFIYVRNKPKEHGRQNLIEGELFEGQRVVVIEDLISTGGSGLQAVKAIKEAKGEVAGLVSIFSYGLDIASENFAEAKCPFYSLADYNTLIKYSIDNSLIQPKQIEVLNQWRKDPQNWNK